MSNHEDITVLRSVKGGDTRPLLVAVIASADDLARAARLRRPPDLFELRLDCLASPAAELQSSVALLRTPLIITARHPAEGGLNNLSTARRRDLLLRFLPDVAFVDIELRSAEQLGAVLNAASELKVRRIVSVHDLQGTASLQHLRNYADAAHSLGADVLKVATRTDHVDELERLVAFLRDRRHRIAVSAMGIGKLGRLSRRWLARNGSVLNYAHLGTAAVEGQLSLAEMRRVIASSATRATPDEGRVNL
jgi:3-dehydroquinate dehydratase-1